MGKNSALLFMIARRALVHVVWESSPPALSSPLTAVRVPAGVDARATHVRTAQTI